MSKSVYSRWFCCIQISFRKSTDSNQFLEIFFQKAFATVLARKLYSYEVNVLNLSCLRFQITISWLEIWNETAWNSAKTLLRTDFCFRIFMIFSSTILFLIMQDFLRQCLMTKSAEFVVKNSLLLLLIEIFTIRCEIDSKYLNHSFVVSFAESILAKSTFFLFESYEFHRVRVRFYLLHRQFTRSKRQRYNVFWLTFC